MNVSISLLGQSRRAALFVLDEEGLGIAVCNVQLHDRVSTWSEIESQRDHSV